MQSWVTCRSSLKWTVYVQTESVTVGTLTTESHLIHDAFMLGPLNSNLSAMPSSKYRRNLYRKAASERRNSALLSLILTLYLLKNNKKKSVKAVHRVSVDHQCKKHQKEVPFSHIISLTFLHRESGDGEGRSGWEGLKKIKGKSWWFSEVAGKVFPIGVCPKGEELQMMFLFCWDVRRQKARRERRMEKLSSAMEMMEIKLCVSGCGDIAMRVYKYTRPKSGGCTCLCVSWASLNVTQNYLNKLKTEVIAASVAATWTVTLARCMFLFH